MRLKKTPIPCHSVRCLLNQGGLYNLLCQTDTQVGYKVRVTGLKLMFVELEYVLVADQLHSN